jgi:transcriptional regulator with XRE-family HTH domain
MSKKPLGHDFHTHRVEKNLTLRQLARQVGCTASYLHRIESGKCAPTDECFLLRLAQALSLTENQSIRLIEAAQESQTTFRLTGDLSLKAYRIANLLVRYIANLNDGDLDEIDLILTRASRKGVIMPTR